MNNLLTLWKKHWKCELFILHALHALGGMLPTQKLCRTQSGSQFPSELELFRKKYSASKFQAPLHASLALTPLVLFRTIAVHNHTGSREYFLKVWFLVFQTWILCFEHHTADSKRSRRIPPCFTAKSWLSSVDKADWGCIREDNTNEDATKFLDWTSTWCYPIFKQSWCWGCTLLLSR